MELPLAARPPDIALADLSAAAERIVTVSDVQIIAALRPDRLPLMDSHGR